MIHLFALGMVHASLAIHVCAMPLLQVNHVNIQCVIIFHPMHLMFVLAMELVSMPHAIVEMNIQDQHVQTIHVLPFLHMIHMFAQAMVNA